MGMAQQSVEIRRHQHRATFAARCEVSARDFEWRRHNGLECSTEPCAELKAVRQRAYCAMAVASHKVGQPTHPGGASVANRRVCVHDAMMRATTTFWQEECVAVVRGLERNAQSAAINDEISGVL